MNDDPIQTLFDDTGAPPVNDVAKQRSKRAAMAAFREEMKNDLETDQGNDEEARLTRKQPNARKEKMSLSTKKVWFSGLAACCVLTLGTLTFKSDINVDPLPVLTVEERDVLPQITALKDQIQLADLDEAIVTEAPKPIAIPIPESVGRLVKSKEAFASGQLAVAQAPRKSMKKVMGLRMPSPSRSNIRVEREVPIHSVAEDRNKFSHTQENSTQLTQANPVSTFSIDVDTASYSFMRRQLNRGALPQRDAIRIEELVNYFDYDYPVPKDKSQPFEPTVVVTNSPWAKGNKLVHIGIKGYDIPKSSQPDSNLVFLLDVSGSMNSADKLPLVKQSMGLLLDTLKPTDTVAIVVYAGAAGTVLEPTQVKQKDKILAALNRLSAGGSTAGGAGLSLAYQLAEQNFKKGSVNRILLATDGDFNVGVTKDERLEDFVTRKRDSGIYLSVLGFGNGNYQDALMQTLAQNGNGIAAYIDTLSEAQKVLVEEATSSLFPIANDVKIQVEFNPKTVSEYRLIGYETRALKREDFNNDKVDAGDIGSGHTVTAIYEVTPVGSASALVDGLRYGNKKEKKRQVQANDSGEYGFLKLRYKLPGAKKSLLITKPIRIGAETKGGHTLAESVNFATAVTGFAQILKGSKFIQSYSYDDVIKLAQSNKGADEFGYRTEFIQLVRRAKIAK